MSAALVGSIITAILPRVLETVDKTVKDEDLAVKIRAQLTTELLANNSAVTKAASEVVMAEAQGESWLQRNWRPMLMVWFALLIGGYWFGFVPANMPISVVESLFTLVQIGVGGYVVGRTGEKIAATLGPHLGNRG